MITSFFFVDNGETHHTMKIGNVHGDQYLILVRYVLERIVANHRAPLFGPEGNDLALISRSWHIICAHLVRRKWDFC